MSSVSFHRFVYNSHGKLSCLKTRNLTMKEGADYQPFLHVKTDLCYITVTWLNNNYQPAQTDCCYSNFLLYEIFKHSFCYVCVCVCVSHQIPIQNVPIQSMFCEMCHRYRPTFITSDKCCTTLLIIIRVILGLTLAMDIIGGMVSAH